MLEKFKNDVEKQQAEQMTDWQTKLVMMDSKERQYILQVSNYKVTIILYDSYLELASACASSSWFWLARCGWQSPNTCADTFHCWRNLCFFLLETANYWKNLVIYQIPCNSNTNIQLLNWMLQHPNNLSQAISGLEDALDRLTSAVMSMLLSSLSDWALHFSDWC